MADTNLPTALKDLTVKLKAWNQDTFGDIFRRRKRKELRLRCAVGTDKKKFKLFARFGEGTEQGEESHTIARGNALASEISYRVAEVR